MCFARQIFVFAACALVCSTATLTHAYPTSVVFIPSADALPYGRLQIGGFAAMPVYPQTQFGLAMFAIGAGLVPKLPLFGDFTFGGVEVTPTLTVDPNQQALAFNAKMQLLVDQAWVPDLSIGWMFSATRPQYDVRIGYVTLGKKIYISEQTYVGRITAGLAHSFAPRDRRAPACIDQNSCAFRGSAPFVDQNLGLLLGYESPAWGIFSVAIDHFGGSSSLSSTNIALNATVHPGVILQLGAFVAHERRREVVGEQGAIDGVLFGFFYNYDLIKQ